MKLEVMVGDKVNWLPTEELLGFFESMPTRDEETLEFTVAKADLTLKFELCQADRYACIRLYVGASNTPLIELPLPKYGSVAICESDGRAALTIEPPNSLEEVESGSVAVIAPVTLVIRPEFAIQIDRSQNRILA